MGSPASFTPRFCRSPEDFEAAAADWMRAWGMSGVRLTAAGADGGTDVDSNEAVAQVKAHMVPVGAPDVQQLKGAAWDGRAALFFSLMSYTSAAVQFADTAGVCLFRFAGYDGVIEPVNERGRQFLASIEDRSGVDGDIRSLLENAGYDENLGDLELSVVGAMRAALRVEPAGTGAFMLRVTTAENRFVQGQVSSGAIDLESVGPNYASPELDATEVEQLARLGWHPPEAGGNYSAGFRRSADSALRLVVETLRIHGAESPGDVRGEVFSAV